MAKKLFQKIIFCIKNKKKHPKQKKKKKKNQGTNDKKKTTTRKYTNPKTKQKTEGIFKEIIIRILVLAERRTL